MNKVFFKIEYTDMNRDVISAIKATEGKTKLENVVTNIQNQNSLIHHQSNYSNFPCNENSQHSSNNYKFDKNLRFHFLTSKELHF